MQFTSGALTDQQLVIVYGIAAYFVLAPMLLGLAAFLGMWVRPTRPDAEPASEVSTPLFEQPARAA